MRDGQKRRLRAQLRITPRRSAMKQQVRRAAVARNFDVAPQDLLRVPGAERFHRRFLRGEPSGKVYRRDAAPAAVCDLAVSEHALDESIAVALDGGGDSVDVGDVKPESDDAHESSPA